MILNRRVSWRCMQIALLVAASTATLPTLANEVEKEHGAQSVSGASGVVASAFHGTAYLKTSQTLLYDGQSYGVGRQSMKGLIDQCNSARDMYYHLSPTSPPESMVTALDVTTQEKYFDTNKALTLRTGNRFTLADYFRWMADLKGSTGGQPPAVPPDCAQTKPVESRSGTLWRDGLVYELRFSDHKAFARPDRPMPPTESLNEAFLNAPTSTYLGQRCKEMVVGADLPGAGNSCIWDLFPYVSYLNWPFVLSGRIQLLPMTGMFETTVPIEIRHGDAIPSSVFEVPAGLTVIRH